MDVVRNLEKARKTITPKEKWCTGQRWEVLRDGEYAHCALGALEAAIGQNPYERKYRRVDRCTPEVLALASTIPPEEKEKTHREGGWGRGLGNDGHVAQYNNRSTHEEVLAWFDRTIAKEKEHPMERV